MTRAEPSRDAALRPGIAHRIARTEPMPCDAVRTLAWRGGVTDRNGLWCVFAAISTLLLRLIFPAFSLIFLRCWPPVAPAA